MKQIITISEARKRALESLRVRKEKRKVSLAGSSGYEPWTPPFRYDDEGQWIEDSKGKRLLDMRGWGFLTGAGEAALGLSSEVAAQIQDGIGERVTDLLNEDSQAHNVKVESPSQ